MTWWAELYDDLLAEVLLVRDDPTDTARTIEFLRTQLHLPAGARVFDQCCGIGSVSVALAQAGYAVVGVDQAAGYIERGLGDAARAGVSVELHAGDAFEFVPDRPCDGAFNWWTSFGYVLDDAANERMLARAFEALKPGGRFALDYMNIPGVLRHFQPEVVTVRQTSRGPVTLRRLTSVDLLRGTMSKTWIYTLPDGRTVEHPSVVRMYLPHAIAELMEGVGFVHVQALGDLDGAPLGLDSRRCILIGTRP